MPEKSAANNGSFEPVTVILAPLRTVPETNAREHWRKRHARAKRQRWDTYRWLRHLLPGPSWLPWPMTITLTRVSPGLLDADAVAASLKHVGDGVADYLFERPGEGHKFDNDPRLTWEYGQRKGGVRHYSVEIRFEARAEPSQGEVSEP